MSVPAYPGAPTPRARPATVRAATWLLFAIAGITLLKAAVDLVVINTPLSVYRDAYTGETGSGFESIAGATIDILFAAAVAILAIMNNHGRNGSRVTTLVLGGFFLLCGGLNSVGDVATAGRPAGTPAGHGRLAAVLPAGYGIFFALLDLLIALAAVGAVILLALPPSNRFFHPRPAAEYPPPHPAPPYPTAPPHLAPAYPVAPPHLTPAHPTAPPLFGGQSSPGDPHWSPSFGGPAFGPGSSSEPPHTGSLPPIDPWAAQADDHRPRHQDPPTTP